MSSRYVWFTLFLIYFCLVTAPMAQAYIDPGSGSFIFQVLIGGLLAAGVALKTFWGRITAFFSRRGSRERSPEKVD